MNQREGKMRRFALLVVIACCICCNAKDGQDAYAPLRVYEGTWIVTKTKPPSKISDSLVDECALIGHYFACQQTINGEPKDLFIIIPRQETGHYYTQGVNQEGFAYGRAELLIEGNTWTYSSKSRDEKPTFYKTVNVFTGTDHIHFEQSQSPDGVHWTVTEVGDEVRSRGNR